MQENIFDLKLNKGKETLLSEESKELLELCTFLSALLDKDRYISKKEYIYEIDKFQKAIEFFNVLNKSGMLKSYCMNNGLEFYGVNAVLDKLSNIESFIEEKNEAYIQKQLRLEKDYLDTILKECDENIKLDEDQRRVVLTDEDYCLVVAGAGAGKTTTVAAKVKYLVEKKDVDPKKILVISFTNKAVNELKQRIIGELHIACPIATFHATGNAVLRKQNPEKLNIADNSKLYYVIQNYLKNSTLKDENTVNNLILFFASYFDVPEDGTDLKSFFNNIAKSNFTTMRSELEEYEHFVVDSRTKKTVTIQSEILRSRQEVEIANFLYLNGIDYEYEPLYPYNIYLSRKPYTPDFIIRQGDNTAYIEHFGISDKGTNDRFTPKELEAYKKAVKNKVQLHRDHKTKLIYTFSSYKDGKSVTSHLENALIKNGFVLKPRSNKEVLEKLVSQEENKYIRKLVNLIQRFITNFKVNGYTEGEFDRMYHSTQNVRTRLFLNICNDCYLEYEKVLRENNAVDFEDMINESARVLREVKEMKEKLDFDYIIVDEYQDISRQRFDLVSALHDVTDAKIIAVGDDWQSIYAFSGSDITLFTKFAEKVGYAKLLKIVRTYRNSQEVIDIAGTFIQKNKEQIPKDLISPKNIKDPVIIYTYDGKRKEKGEDNRSGANFALAYAVETALKEIAEYNKAEGKRKDSSILLLGRYSFDGDRLERSGLFEYTSRGNQLKSVKYPWMNITFMTAHASKGLGYDNVIIINGKNETYGFPSKIEDDPVLAFVVKGDRAIDYAEERRLFYVAMTRTKNRVFIIAPEQNPSEFLLEIKRDFKNVVLKGAWNEDPEKIPNFRKICPICGYPMQYRYKESLGLRLYICTNEPEICGFMTNEYRAGKLGILKCDLCRDGYLTVKSSSNGDFFLGCTNFKKDGSGCSNSLSRKNYYLQMGIADDIPAPEVIIPKGKDISPNIPTNYRADLTEHNAFSEEETKTAKPLSEGKSGIKDVLYKDTNLYATISAVLQCLSDISTKQYVSVSMLADVLVGTETKMLLKNGFNLLPKFGALSEAERDDVVFIIEWLIKNGYILKTKANYPVLHPTYNGVHYDENITVRKLKELKKELIETEAYKVVAVNELAYGQETDELKNSDNK